MAEENSSKKKGTTEELKEVFTEEREKWKELYRTLLKKFNTSDKRGELLVQLYNYLMDLNLVRTNLTQALIGLKKSIRTKTKDNFISVRTDSDIRIKSNDDQRILIEGALAAQLEKQELMTMQIEFITYMIKDFNTINWGIKTLLDSKKLGED